MNEQVISLLQKKWVVPAAVGVIAFSAGTGLGYILGKRKKSDINVTVVSNSVDSQLAFDFEEAERPEGKMATVFDVDSYRAARDRQAQMEFLDVEDYPEWELEDDAELAIEEDELEDAEPIDNVFAGSDSEWDYEAELSCRSDAAPYVIHVDEFVADEMNFDQKTITYYAGDNIMADHHDTPIYNWAEIMGDLKFGHGSKDKNIVYIRNERIHLEWEILLHTGRFEIEVMGYELEHELDENEIRHSIRKFRAEG